MIDNAYRYVLELTRRDGRPIGEAIPPCDWEVLVESARFEGLRRGNEALASGSYRACVEPRWDEGLGKPYVAALNVSVHPEGGEPSSSAFPVTVFRSAAQAASSELVRRKVLEPGETFLYRTVAHAATAGDRGGGAPDGTAAAVLRETGDGVRDGAPAPGHLSNDERGTPKDAHRRRAPLFKVDAVEARLPLLGGDLKKASLSTLPQGVGHAADHRVFIPRSILDQVTRETLAAGGRECGGVLVGHLFRDRDEGDLYGEITAAVPAGLAEGDASRLRFTPASWCAVRDGIDGRQRGELVQGWYHSHPFSGRCRECPEERKRRCGVGEFFSERDRHVHRTVFPGAHSIALVATESDAGEVAFSLYGWRGGEITRRGFHLAAVQPSGIVTGGSGRTSGGSVVLRTPGGNRNPPSDRTRLLD